MGDERYRTGPIQRVLELVHEHLCLHARSSLYGLRIHQAEVWVLNKATSVLLKVAADQSCRYLKLPKYHH